MAATVGLFVVCWLLALLIFVMPAVLAGAALAAAGLWVRSCYVWDFGQYFPRDG